MFRTSSALLGASLLCGLLATLTGLHAEPPTIEELCAAAPRLDTQSDDCPAFAARALVHLEQAEVSISADFRDGALRLLARDAVDQFPLMALDGRRLLLYDPVGAQVIAAEDAAIMLSLSLADRRLQAGMGVHGGPEAAPRLQLDVRSLLEVPQSERHIEERADGVHVLVVTSEQGNRIEYVRDRSQTPERISLSLQSHDAPRPFLEIEILPIDGAPPAPVLPDPVVLQQKLPVKIMSADDDVLQNIAGTGSILRAAFVHAAVRSPELRADLPAAWLVGIDWDKVAENNLRWGPALREALGSLADVQTVSGEVPGAN